MWPLTIHTSGSGAFLRAGAFFLARLAGDDPRGLVSGSLHRLKGNPGSDWPNCEAVADRLELGVRLKETAAAIAEQRALASGDVVAVYRVG